MTIKYALGQELVTEEVGPCTVTDIFISPTSGVIVYELTTNDGATYHFTSLTII